jgi:hypothetical protein
MEQLNRTRNFLSGSVRILFILSILIIVSLACNLPGREAPVVDEKQPGFVETSVAETIAVQEGANPEEQQQEEAAPPPTDTATPDVTLTPSLTPTATYTLTPEVAMVSVSGNTNCRTGQGTSFQWLVTLMEGEEAEAVGIDTSGDYWYIRRPDQPSGFCWLWGEYATASGPYQALPVYTQVPTPTPGFDFKVSYQKVIDCGFIWGVQYRIDNTGSFKLESWKTTSEDQSGGLTNAPNEQNVFGDYTGCVLSGQQVDLVPGEAYYLNAVFDGDPTGHKISTKIRICTKDDLGGDCLTKTFTHTP